MTKPREKTREELQAEIEDGKKKIRQFENREKMLRQKLSKEERRTRSHRLIAVSYTHLDVYKRQGKHDMTMGVAAVGVMDSKIHAHSSGNKLRGTVFPDKPYLFLS